MRTDLRQLLRQGLFRRSAGLFYAAESVDHRQLDCGQVQNVQVYTVLMDVEPVPFNKGFFSVDMTFYFLVRLEAVVSPMTPPVKVEGISVFQKKVILYGSEGSVNQFTSNRLIVNNDKNCCCDENLPTANLSVVDPICLACRVCDVPDCGKEVQFTCPAVVSKLFDDEFDSVRPAKIVASASACSPSYNWSATFR